jgi:hypothetical protein
MQDLDRPGVATVKQARLFLGKLSQEGFYKLINAGELVSFKIGSKRYVSHAALADFIARREQAEAERRAAETDSDATSAA